MMIAESETKWNNWPNGARAAVALTYDDATPDHPRLVAPALQAHGLRGTFYAPIRGDLISNTEAWRELAHQGHELGNHTIFHPCRRDPVEPPNVTADWNNLQHFTEERFRNELQISNFVLHLIDGQTTRTYGNTCHNTTIGPDDNPQRIEPILADYFVAARGERHERPANPAGADLFNMGTISGDGRQCAEWCGFIERALEIGGMVIFTFHKVGRGYERLQVDETEHTQLLRYLQQNRHIWTAPLVEIANWLDKEKLGT